MKATPAQSLVIDKIIAHIQSWKTSPDINSPTQYNLNYEVAVELTDRFEQDAYDICDAFDALLDRVLAATE